MPRKDPRIDAYIAKARPFARPILRRLRITIHTACPAVEETIKWGFPNFVYQSRILCHMAAFKAHVAFGFWHQKMAALLAHEVGKAGDALGQLGRITTETDLPDDATLQRYLRIASNLIETGSPAQTKTKAKVPPRAPADLVAALKRCKSAAATWEKFRPSHRREYIEWLTEAKRPETRDRRLAITLEWLAEGKSRHWKYQNC